MSPATPQLVASLALVGLLADAAPLRAEPLRLDDPTPRSVIVQFENSPREVPAQLDASWGPPLPARLESAGADLVRVVVEGPVVEQHLFGDDTPEPGSFGDFVWLFDVRSRHVLDARLEGRLVQQLDWGLVRSTTQANVRARMSTREQAGFLPPRRILGNQLFRHCDPVTAPGLRCRPVGAVPFDPATGYVNAVGVIEVETPLGLEARTFSPLGEALFLELPPVGAAPLVVDAQETLPSASVE
jgi:hypothetical protein